MSSHPDRVRRNYHALTLRESDDPVTRTKRVEILIARDDIASAMSAREVNATVLRSISQGIDRAYGQAH